MDTVRYIKEHTHMHVYYSMTLINSEMKSENQASAETAAVYFTLTFLVKA